MTSAEQFLLHTLFEKEVLGNLKPPFFFSAMVNNINRELGMLKSKYKGPISMAYYLIFSE